MILLTQRKQYNIIYSTYVCIIKTLQLWSDYLHTLSFVAIWNHRLIVFLIFRFIKNNLVTIKWHSFFFTKY